MTARETADLPLDFDELVDLGAKAAFETLTNSLWSGASDPHIELFLQDARAILSAVLPHVLAGPREALGDAPKPNGPFPIGVNTYHDWYWNRRESALARIDKLTEGM